MPRRKSKSKTDQRRRNFRSAEITPRQRKAPRNLERRRAYALPSPLSAQSATPIVGVRSQRTQKLSTRFRDRRDVLRPGKQIPTFQRLSTGLVSTRPADENARTRSSKRCTRSKAERRGVILATGYGGINGATNYRRSKKCS